MYVLLKFNRFIIPILKEILKVLVQFNFKHGAM